MESVSDLTAVLNRNQPCCLHVNGSLEAVQLLEELKAAAREASRERAVARHADWKSWFQRKWHRDRTATWLAVLSGISIARAEHLIKTSSARINPILGHNAGDPLGMLSVLAVTQGDALPVYNIVGTSPTGGAQIHAYMISTGRPFIHISSSGYSTSQDSVCRRVCPDGDFCRRWHLSEALEA